LNERQQKWVSKLQAYDFDIEYVKGKKNVVSDALSRRPEMCSFIEISADWKSHLVVEYSKNKFACEVRDHDTQQDRYKVVDDIIYYKDRIYLVPESALKEKIMEAMHNTPLAGHPRYFKTYMKIRERFTWKAKQVRVGPFYRIITAVAHSRAEMGEYIHGLYHRVAKGLRPRLYLCSGRLVDQICTLLCHILRV
jgi:hypothetical protein